MTNKPVEIRRTAKLFIGGKFPRSESARSFEVLDRKGNFLANASLASRKDARDAVVAARAAFAGWSGATAYNRGQVLYRVAEIMQGRRNQFVDELAAWIDHAAAEREVDAAIDRWVWFAGWADKLAMVTGSNNPVAGPFFNFSVPEPTGVIAGFAPTNNALIDLVELVASAIVSGNTVVVVASLQNPLPAVSLGEVLATSDVPGGVVNILTGDATEIAPWLASHMDVNAIDLSGISDAKLAFDLEVSAAENLKRILRAGASVQGLARIKTWLETKTVWHPRGF
ncbi:MAG: aldehyde dehydrogenase family protein [Actinomycetes bacterium]